MEKRVAIGLRRAIRPSPKDSGSVHPLGKKKTLYKLRAFNMTATLPRSGRPSKLSTRSTTKIQNQIKGNEHITSRVLQTFLLPSGTKASAAIIWRAVAFPGEWVEGSLCSQKRTKLPCFNLPREHLGKPEAFWKSILWTDVSTRIIWLQSKTSILGEQNLPPTVKHDGGDVKVWVCSSASASEPPFYPRNHELSSLSSKSCYQSGRWSWDECGLCIKIMTRNIPTKLQWDWYRYSRLAQSESGP